MKTKMKLFNNISSLDKKQDITENNNIWKDFFDIKNIKESKWINKDFYKKQIKEFKEKNPFLTKNIKKI